MLCSKVQLIIVWKTLSTFVAWVRAKFSHVLMSLIPHLLCFFFSIAIEHYTITTFLCAHRNIIVTTVFNMHLHTPLTQLLRKLVVIQINSFLNVAARNWFLLIHVTFLVFLTLPLRAQPPFLKTLQSISYYAESSADHLQTADVNSQHSESKCSSFSRCTRKV